jgi:hypothetical protein
MQAVLKRELWFSVIPSTRDVWEGNEQEVSSM